MENRNKVDGLFLILQSVWKSGMKSTKRLHQDWLEDEQMVCEEIKEQ